jgi:DNA-binding MarR family transcriptional regulator
MALWWREGSDAGGEPKLLRMGRGMKCHLDIMERYNIMAMFPRVKAGATIMFFFLSGARETLHNPQLERFAQALETAQTRYPNLTLGMLSTLLRIGMSPSRTGEMVSISDLVARYPGQKYPTIARQIDLLGEGNSKVPGLGLIEKQADIDDRRVRYVAVSAKGKLLLHELGLILAPKLHNAVGRTKTLTRDD